MMIIKQTNVNVFDNIIDCGATYGAIPVSADNGEHIVRNNHRDLDVINILSMSGNFSVIDK